MTLECLSRGQSMTGLGTPIHNLKRGLGNVIGFLIIAFEWRHTYLHTVFLRETQVQEDQDRTKADQQGRNYEDSTQADASMWRHTQRPHTTE
jgi:hypothetical protein